MDLQRLTLPEIRELIAEGQLAEVADVLDTWLPADLGSLIAALDDSEQVKLLLALRPPRESKAFEYLDFETQRRLLLELPDEIAARIVDGMSPDDRTALLTELPAESSGRLLGLLSPAERAVAQSLLNYPANSVGRLMTPDYVAVLADWTIKHVLDHVRSHGKDRETLNVIYVIDKDQRLVDDIRIREFLLAPLHASVRDIMDRQYVALTDTQDKKVAVAVFKKYDRTALPVIDDAGKLVGIVTIDDVLDVAEEEATREIQRLGGSEALEDPYMSTPLLSMVRKRATWLVILFVGEMLTATAMGFFEGEISKAVVLALFIPLIISSGGNSGSQASTLIVRALALGEVRLSEWWTVMKRELASGLMLGLILGSIGFTRIMLWTLIFNKPYGDHPALVATTVGLSLVGIVLWGSISGSMLPFVLKRCRLDPATSSAPFVATLVDVTGLIIYFSVAYVVLSGTML